MAMVLDNEVFDHAGKRGIGVYLLHAPAEYLPLGSFDIYFFHDVANPPTLPVACCNMGPKKAHKAIHRGVGLNKRGALRVALLVASMRVASR